MKNDVLMRSDIKSFFYDCLKIMVPTCSPMIIQDGGLNLEELVLCLEAYVYVRNRGSLGLVAGWPDLSMPAKMKLAEIHTQMKLLINEATEIIKSETKP